MVVYQYDLNSAYARTYRDLPCLLHGTWRRSTDVPRGGIFVANVDFYHEKESFIYTLPVRTRTGSIVFPRQASGTYWSPELLLAQAEGCTLTFNGGFEYEKQCDCRWFDWVEPIYAERKAMGKDAAGMVLKTMLATIYGKLAQSVGTAPYANAIWAGLITSTVRNQLCRAALSDSSGTGADVVMLATDGLFCTERRTTLDIGSELGQWSETIHDSMFVVQSGVYMLPEHDPKTRGVSQRKVIQHTWDFYAAWKRYLTTGIAPSVTVSLRQFIGLKTASFRNRLDLAGQWLDVTRTINFDWTSKRDNPRIDGSMVRTSAPSGSPRLVSKPYTRLIGGGSFRELNEEQPDWSDVL